MNPLIGHTLDLRSSRLAVVSRAGTLLLATGFAALTRGAVVFDFSPGNNYVTADQPLRLADGTAFAPGGNRPFSTAPMHPASGYTGPAFFGGFHCNEPLELAQVRNDGSNDPIRFRRGSSNNTIIHGLVLGAVETSVFDTTSSVTVSGARAGHGSADLRLVLGFENEYYISTSIILSISGYAGDVAVVDATALAGLSFLAYDPATDLAYGGNASDFDPFKCPWDQVGVLASYQYSLTATRTNLEVFVRQVKVDAVPPPAPTGTVISVR